MAKKLSSIVLTVLLLLAALLPNVPAAAAGLSNQIPQIKYASAPVTEYFAGDRIRFDIYAPNYGGRVEYRVILWDDNRKTYYDLWNAENGHPSRYYTNWQPTGNTVFTLGWPIFEPGYYRITVLVKRLGIPNSKTVLKGMNCDSYMESVAFLVKPGSAEVDYILPVTDVSVTQGDVPILPQTVKAVLKDKTERNLRVTWENASTLNTGIFPIMGSVEGTDKRAELRLIVNPRVLNIYTIAAVDRSCVNVVLRDTIEYLPDVSRFYITGNNGAPVRIYSDALSQDRRTVQLYTDTMSYGEWYKLTIDGREYPFQIPKPPIPKISMEEIYDVLLEAGGQITVNILTLPENAALTATSSNKKVATFEIKDRKLIIKGVDAGTATITVTAQKSGYESIARSFKVIVNRLTATPGAVNESQSLDNTIQLEIKGYGGFRRGFSINDIALGEDFSNLKVEVPNTLDVQSSKMRVRLTGNLVYKKGYGTIIISPRGWNGNYSLTAKVEVTRQVSKPIALPDAGEVNSGTKVVLYSSTNGAKVYYTIDGTNPTIKSKAFDAPIVITKTTKIKAIAVKSGMKDSETVTFLYTVKDDTPKPVTIRDGDFRAVQGNVIEKPKERVYIQKLANRKWSTIASTNEESSNGQLKGFFVSDNIPFAIIDNSKMGLVIVTPKNEGLASITGYMDSDGEIQYGEYRAVQGNVIGEKKERVYIQKLSNDKWEIISSTWGSGDNGKLRGFFVINKTPYVIIQYNDSGDFVITSKNETLDQVKGKVIWD